MDRVAQDALVDSRSMERIFDWVRAKPLLASLTVVIGLGVGAGSFAVVQAVGAANSIATEEFDPTAVGQTLSTRTEADIQDQIAAREAQLLAEAQAQRAQALTDAEIQALLEELQEQRHVDEPFVVPNTSSPPLPDEMFNSVLLIGADASGFLADVLIYVLVPSDGSTPIMVSLPRDLYLSDACTGGYARVNSALGGCRGVASGPELLSLTVADFTGIEVDHFARVNFSGFEWVVDQLGGTTVCVGDRPIRDPKSGLELGPGCHEADGRTTLAWVRSRNPEFQGEDGEWTRPGGSDFDRQTKQQEILFQLAGKLTSASSVGALSSILSNLSSVVRTDSGWGVGEMASLAFQYRSIDSSSVRRLSISVQNYRTPGGAQVLIPARRFNDTLAAVYPAAARSADE